MWDNPRLLNMAAGNAGRLAVLVFAIVGVALLARSPLFPVTEIELTPCARQDHAGRDRGGRARPLPRQLLRAVDLGAARGTRGAAVGAQGHGAPRLAGPAGGKRSRSTSRSRAGATALVNTYGELFDGATDARLPVFIGPAGTRARDDRNAICASSKLLAPLGRGSSAGASAAPCLAAQADSGLQIMLGRDAEAPRRASPASSRPTRARSAGSRAGTSTWICAIPTASPLRVPERAARLEDRHGRRDNKNLIVGLDIGTSKVACAGRRSSRADGTLDARHGQPRSTA